MSRKKFTFQYDEAKANIHAASKEIGRLMAAGNKDAAENKRKKLSN